MLRMLMVNQSMGVEESPVFGKLTVGGSTHPSIACHCAYNVMDLEAVKFVSSR